MKIIPALELLGGKCVRLVGGDYRHATTHSPKPLAVARQFEAAGLTHLHLVDLDGARTRVPTHLELLRTISQQTSLQVDFSGGLSSDEQVRAAFAAGAAQITVGSWAVREPALVERWLQEWGPERIIIGADFRDGFIVYRGWEATSQLKLADFIADWLHRGATTFLCTDVRRDETLAGPATAIYAALGDVFPQAQILAAGGIRAASDFNSLRAAGVASVVVGRGFYEGRITLPEMVAGR